MSTMPTGRTVQASRERDRPAPSDQAPALPRRRRVGGGGAAPYLFVLPFVVLFVVFMVAPIVIAIVNSTFSSQSSGLGFGGASTVFVGVQNYLRAFGDRDFLASFGRVLLYGVVQVPLMMVIAATLALLFDSALVRAKRAFQFAVFLPYAVPGVIAALLWGFFYQPSVSPLVQGLQSLGIDADLLAPGTILWSVANVGIWSYAGINMIILFSALQAVPSEVFEAARLDGAGDLRIALSIKLPMIAPAVLLTTLSTVIGTLQLFNEPQVLQSITPNISSDWTPNMAVYAASTLGRDAHLGSAMAVILGVVTLAVSLLLVRATNVREGGNGR
ncbi:sugar ABC transporter permease [Actinotalea sp. M2MS4P-6]|uniref:carbohydrate ABC transporter permease n=1 Tax=Actinotalea sp. M2MS4P-6 TaxID=2983762 RepID=UPI0021E3FEEC|nr:sugar ABC transporter permease [Actinotalea sp. M2MS4P-6]MCV2394473.1 sugar ABC transporter permease [Actinotalea sp. M2MS4P-6]